jgi:hypothetical protein
MAFAGAAATGMVLAGTAATGEVLPRDLRTGAFLRVIRTAGAAAAGEDAFLRDRPAARGVEGTALAALTFIFGGDSGFFGFINYVELEARHRAAPIIAAAFSGCNQKIPHDCGLGDCRVAGPSRP